MLAIHSNPTSGRRQDVGKMALCQLNTLSQSFYHFYVHSSGGYFPIWSVLSFCKSYSSHQGCPVIPAPSEATDGFTGEAMKIMGKV